MGRRRTKNKHLPQYVRIIHGSYWHRPPGGKEKRICAVGDESALYKFLALQATPAGPMTTINDCIDRYVRDVLPTLKPSTQRDYRRYLGTLRAWCGDMRPNDLTPRDVGKLLDVDKGKISRNRLVAVLSALYSKMVGRWYVAERNPCISVERHSPRRRDRYVTEHEFQAVYAIVPPRIKVAMDLALLTGQRQGDLLRLRWDQVTDEGVFFRQGKTGKRLLVAASPALETVLKRARAIVPNLPREYVLRNQDGQPYTSDGFRSIWSRWMRNAKGIKRKDGTWKRAPVITEGFTFHDLRAKSTSDAGSLNEAYERAGHSDMALTRSVYDRGVRKVRPLK